MLSVRPFPVPSPFRQTAILGALLLCLSVLPWRGAEARIAVQTEAEAVPSLLILPSKLRGDGTIQTYSTGGNPEYTDHMKLLWSGTLELLETPENDPSGLQGVYRMTSGTARIDRGGGSISYGTGGGDLRGDWSTTLVGVERLEFHIFNEPGRGWSARANYSILVKKLRHFRQNGADWVSPISDRFAVHPSQMSQTRLPVLWGLSQPGQPPPFSMAANAVPVTVPAPVPGGTVTHHISASPRGSGGVKVIWADRNPAHLRPEGEPQDKVTVKLRITVPAGRRPVKWNVTPRTAQIKATGTKGDHAELSSMKPAAYKVTADLGGGQTPLKVTIYIVRVTISGSINRRPNGNLPKSLPPAGENRDDPARIRELRVKVEPSLAGSSHRVLLEASGDQAEAGLASLEPRELKATTMVKVRGETMTKEGFTGQLKVHAYVGRQECAQSEGFTVCAHPEEIRFHYREPWRNHPGDGPIAGLGPWYGALFTRNQAPGSEARSDSGNFHDLDAVELMEKVSISPTGWFDTIPAAGRNVQTAPAPATRRTGPDGSPAGDRHAIKIGPFELSAITQAALLNNGNAGGQTAMQKFIFHCKRCGAGGSTRSDGTLVGETVPSSGFRITYGLMRRKGGFTLRVEKTGAVHDGANPGFVDAPGPPGPEYVMVP